MELLERVRAALRVSTDDEGINEEIKALILAAEADLQTTGIHLTGDPLYELTLTVYCKAHFGFDNPEASRFQEVYESLKHKMMNTKEYRDAQHFDGKSHTL